MNNHYSDSNSSFEPGECSILLITDQEGTHRSFHDALVEGGFPVATCAPSSIAMMLEQCVPSIALVCSDESVHEHLQVMLDSCPEVPVLTMTQITDCTDVLDLVEAGAWDYVSDSCSPTELIDRIRSLSLIGSDAKLAMSEMQGLKGLCRRLCSSNRELSKRFVELREDLAVFRSDHDSQVDVASTVSAFQALLSQELGIEGVLQTALEFILGKTGPTNAAIFLADSPTSYSLGAYVNCDCPREQADPVLKKFAKDVCHHVAAPDDLVRFQDVDAFIEAMGVDAEILQSSEIVGMPCCFDDECLAVVFLFRSKEESFSEELAPILDSLRGALAEQLATIVNIHHRIADHWPDESTDESSDWGFGTGGNKAA